MTMMSVFILNVLAALFNSVLSIYITNSKQCYEHDKVFVYLAFIISCGAFAIDIIYCLLY